ncbi:MAG: L,D-transpeptidase [Kofleriaceae bacterium]
MNDAATPASPAPARRRRREPSERWIDVDLAQQVLVAYEGTIPVYATLVSTAARKYVTPAGIWRIGAKDVKRRMRNAEESATSWNVADVPYVMSFRKMYALHGAYWHDGFGRQRSHGCVNLAPADAQRMFEWSLPEVPAGWISVRDDGAGTPLRIHGPAVTDPPWRDHEGQVVPLAEVLARP